MVTVRKVSLAKNVCKVENRYSFYLKHWMWNAYLRHWRFRAFSFIPQGVCSISYHARIRTGEFSISTLIGVHFFHVTIGLIILVLLCRACKRIFCSIGSLWKPYELGFPTFLVTATFLFSCHCIFTMIFTSKTSNRNHW